MADLLNPDVHVYQGIWTNWSRGPINGLTWTLSPTKSTLLTNTLALFVALAGGQLWNIIRFAIHQIRASYRSEEESHESRAQQQVVLRNTDTDLGTLRLMLQLAWNSRSTGKQLSFPILIATLAILHYGLFILAGTFSTLASAGSAAPRRSNYGLMRAPTRFGMSNSASSTPESVMTPVQGPSQTPGARARSSHALRFLIALLKGSVLSPSCALTARKRSSSTLKRLTLMTILVSTHIPMID
jgi:hypothetical protein